MALLILSILEHASQPSFFFRPLHVIVQKRKKKIGKHVPKQIKFQLFLPIQIQNIDFIMLNVFVNVNVNVKCIPAREQNTIK